MYHDAQHEIPVLAYCAADIARIVLSQNRRLLLHGPAGAGKSTLAAHLAQALSLTGQRCHCICADPGSPAFGLPGAIALAKWQTDSWQVYAYEALCSLDAARFRLPLVLAVARPGQLAPDEPLLIDMPGVTRGVAGSELLQGLYEASDADAVLTLTTGNQPPALFSELRSVTTRLFIVHASTEARRPGKRSRARQRTRLWGDFLGHGREQTIDLEHIPIVGTPPPLGEASVWIGRQIALMDRSQTGTLAEVTNLQHHRLTVCLPTPLQAFDSLLVRDAQRASNGLLETAAPFAAEPLAYRALPDLHESPRQNNGPYITGRSGTIDFCLVNGIFGDPLLHVRLRQHGRSLLFDLGAGIRLPARIAHQVTDVFISHAHIDHIGGFMMLLRSRIGQFPPCRLYGPAGLARHISGFLQGILWDRVAERAPRFEIAELHSDRLLRFRLQAGQTSCEPLSEARVEAGVILQEPGFRIRAQQLDHHHTPVLAYAFEPAMTISIRQDRLQAQQLAPGPWLTELKKQLLAGHSAALLTLPNGRQGRADELAAELTLVKRGKKLVYATDLADTLTNREHLQELAQYAHTFFCEACFIEADREQAVRTGHLTTRACAEIAMAAEVARLIPFHFSQRYINDCQQIYDEVQAIYPRVARPPAGITTRY